MIDAIIEWFRNITFLQIIDFVGTFAFAISGIRLASAKRFDWFGAYVVGAATAIGGGTKGKLWLHILSDVLGIALQTTQSSDSSLGSAMLAGIAVDAFRDVEDAVEKCVKQKDIVYPINYGYIPGVLGGDDEELDVFLLGVDEPVESYETRIIAVVHREDDVEDKLVACPLDHDYDAHQICRKIYFQEKFYDTTVETVDGQKLHISNGEKNGN